MALDITPSNLMLVLAVVLLIGFLGRWIFTKTRVPDTLLLMLLGFGIGQLFDIQTEPFLDVMPFVGVLALIAILFDGGLDLKFNDLIRGLPRASALSFAGFLLSVFVATIYGHFAFNLSFMKAALLGAIVGGTSAVIIMPMLPGLKLGKRAETVLSLESALTDVLCVVVALALAATIAEGGSNPLSLASTLTASFTVALFFGFIGGLLWLLVVHKVRDTGSEYVWTLAALMLLYGLTELLGGSGPIAVLMFGIILGNAGRVTRMFRMPERRLSYNVDRMQDELVFFVRSFFFVYLGLVFDPGFLSTDNFWTSPLLKAIGLLVVLILARVGAVALATLGDNKLIEHRVRFVMLMPRGLAAAVLAAIPAAAPYNITGVESFVSYAFAILLFTNIMATFAGLVGTDPSKFKPSWIGRKAGTVEAEVDETINRGATTK